MTVTPSFDNGQFFTLEWSAPGNDYVYGKAYQYKIQCFQGKNSKEIDINQEDLPLPEVYGTKQSVVLRIPEKNVAYFYTIFAIDEVYLCDLKEQFQKIRTSNLPNMANPKFGLLKLIFFLTNIELRTLKNPLKIMNIVWPEMAHRPKSGRTELRTIPNLHPTRILQKFQTLNQGSTHISVTNLLTTY